jgi:hypothetical protein
VPGVDVDDVDGAGDETLSGEAATLARADSRRIVSSNASEAGPCTG